MNAMSKLTILASVVASAFGCTPDHPVDTHEQDHDHEELVLLSDEQLEEFGIVVDVAGPATLELEVKLAGEIVANADQVAHIVPRVPGVVREVKKRIGDHVQPDEVMAVLDSRDLATVKARFLAAHARHTLARATLEREESLWKKKVGSEQEYLEAKSLFEEAKIALREGKQALHALGLSEEDVLRLLEAPDTTLTRYEIRAPFGGEVIERHVVRGELLKEDSQAFVVADLGSVWVNLTVHQKDLPFIRVGQIVRVSPGRELGDVVGTISYFSPLVDEATRTATARVVLANEAGELRPGLFVSAAIVAEKLEAGIAVPKSALVESDTAVFVQTDKGFARRSVDIGRSDASHVEIVAGLSAGERYAAQGAFALKSELEKGSFGDGHGH